MKKQLFNFEDIRNLLPSDCEIVGDTTFVQFSNIASSDNVDHETLDWINASNNNKTEYLIRSKAKTIICDKSISIIPETIKDKCVIKVHDPKIVFAKIVNSIFNIKRQTGIHQTAYISENAIIGKNVSIGAFTFIGNCIIGDNTIICDNCSIKDSVQIGDNVYIDSNTVIGSEGFGYVRDEKGKFIKFPHISGVIIKNDVEIGANTTIDRGSLKPTIIESGVKIDNLVHIAHNVSVGCDTAIIANAMIAGSTIIGERCWIAPSSSILEHLNIGDDVTIGVGAVVTKNVPAGEVWAGSPARSLKDFLKIQNKLKELL